MDASVTALTLPLTALAAGFLGSLHCLGMCGGISGTIALAKPLTSPPEPASAATLALGIPLRVVSAAPTGARSTAGGPSCSVPASGVGANVLAFNAGRIASYAIAGALAGSAGGLVSQGWVIGDSFNARAALFVFANVMIVLTGLYLMGLPQLLAPLERAGGRLWRHVSPLTRAFLPMNTVPRAAMFGMIWGWIPCGLVYAMLLSALGAGSALGGAATMLAFGIGTLPAMVFAGLAAGSLRGWTRDSRVRIAAGVIIVALGVAGLARTGALASLQSFGAFCISAMQGAPSTPSKPSPPTLP